MREIGKLSTPRKASPIAPSAMMPPACPQMVSDAVERDAPAAAEQPNTTSVNSNANPGRAAASAAVSPRPRTPSLRSGHPHYFCHSVDPSVSPISAEIEPATSERSGAPCRALEPVLPLSRHSPCSTSRATASRSCSTIRIAGPPVDLGIWSKNTPPISAKARRGLDHQHELRLQHQRTAIATICRSPPDLAGR